MSAGQPNQTSVTAVKRTVRRPWWVGLMLPQTKTAAATLIELGAGIACAEASPAMPPLCSHCRSNRDAQSSTSQYPSVFCSEKCEQEFIRAALASLTLEDCVRMHGRLENLLMSAQQPAGI